MEFHAAVQTTSYSEVHYSMSGNDEIMYLPPSFPGANTAKFFIPGDVRRYMCNYTK